MKKILFPILMFISGVLFANPGDVTVIQTISPKNSAFQFVVRSTNVAVSTSAFTNNLGPNDSNLQHALQTIDQLSVTGGSGSTNMQYQQDGTNAVLTATTNVISPLKVTNVSGKAQFTIDSTSITTAGVLIAGSNITLTPGSGNTTISAVGAGYNIYPASSTTSTPFGASFSTITVTQTQTGAINAAVITSTGTGIPLLVIPQGFVSNGLQNQKGVVTIGDTVNTRPFSTYLVIVDSTTDLQNGGGMIEVWSDSPLHNDPKLWFHVQGHDSSPEIRDDANAPNWEMVNTSTNNAQGLGKFEPAAVAFQGVDLQRNSRAYDNSTFENVEIMHALQNGGGLELAAPLGANGSLYGIDTAPLQFNTTNNHVIGLTGPMATTAGWTFALPTTPNNLGQVMYQSSNGRGGPLNSRQWDFTTGGSSGQFLTFNTGAAPTWTTGSGGGGTSSLAVGTGTASNFTNNISSPTTVLSALGSQFNVLSNGTTAFLSLNQSSVTLQGKLVAGSNITLTPGAGITTIAASGSGGGDVFQAGNNVMTGTNSFSGPLTITSTKTYFNATGDFGVNIGSSPQTTSAAYLFDVSNSTSNGVTIYDNSGKGQGGGNLLTLITTNTFNHAFVMRIIRNNGNDSNGDIRVDSPNPNFEFRDLSQLLTDGSGSFEVPSINSDHANITGRNAANTAYQNIVGFNRLEGPFGGGMIIYSTGSLKFSNGVGSYEGFHPANTFTDAGSWLWTLPLTANNTGQVMIQTSNTPTFQLAFTTGGANGQVLMKNGNSAAWGTVSGGAATPAGSNTNVQYNNGGSFGADNGFQYDSSVSSVTLSGKLQLTDNSNIFRIGDGNSDPFITLDDENGSPGGGIKIQSFGNTKAQFAGTTGDFRISVTTASSGVFVSPRIILPLTNSKTQIVDQNGTIIAQFDPVGNSSFTIPVALTTLLSASSLATDSTGKIIAGSGGGSGGSSTLAVGTGTASNFTTNVTSPTAAISFLGTQFNATTNGTTSFISIIPSSLGSTIYQATATAGFPFGLSASTGNITGKFVVGNSTGGRIELSANLGFPVLNMYAGPGTNDWQRAFISSITNNDSLLEELTGATYILSISSNDSLSAPVTRLFISRLSSQININDNNGVQMAVFTNTVSTISNSLSVTGNYLANGSAGNSGQVLQSNGNGSGNTWVTPSAGTSGINNQNTLQSGSTFYVSSGTVDGALTINGNGVSGMSFVDRGLTINNGFYSIAGSSSQFIVNGASGPIFTVDPMLKTIVSSAPFSDLSIFQSTFTGGLTVPSLLLQNQGNTRIVFMNGSNLGTSSTFSWNGSTMSATIVNPVSSFQVGGGSFTVKTNGNWNVNGATPTLTSCGTSPSVIGGGLVFTITPGTGAGGCTATFSAPLINTPTCNVTPQTGSIVNPFSYTVSNTAVVVSQTGITGLIDINCVGHDKN